MNSNEVSRRIPFDRMSVHLERDQIEPEEKEHSFFKRHRVKLISAVAAAAILALGAYVCNKKLCIFSSYPGDKFNLYYCHDGEWGGLTYIPLTELREREKSCKLGEKIAGCINGEYFHYMSNECLKNPTGWFCKEKTSSVNILPPPKDNHEF